MDGYTSLIKTKVFWVGAVGVLINVLAYFKIDLGVGADQIADSIVNVVNGGLFIGAIAARAVAKKQVVAAVSVTPAKVAAAEVKAAAVAAKASD